MAACSPVSAPPPFGRPAAKLVDPRLSAPAELMRVFAEYRHIGQMLHVAPEGLHRSATLGTGRYHTGTAAEVVVSATSIDLAGLITIKLRVVRAIYEFAEDVT
jgi:hypothetical protein